MIASVAACLIVAALFTATPASSAPERSLPIRLGVGIGPLNLGVTGQQVRRALGRPRAVVERRVVGGRPYIELEWRYGEWNVGLVGRKGNRRVVLVGTGLRGHRTPQGLGVGSTGDDIARRLRGSRERVCGFGRGHIFYRQGSRETVFIPARYSPEYEIIIVEVRAPPTLGCAF